MIKSIIRDYLLIRISAQDFLNQLICNDELLGEIQKKIPDSTCAFDEVWKDCPLSVEAFEHCNFDLRYILSEGYYSLSSVSACDTAYDLIYDLFHDDFPNIPHSDYYSDIAMFAIDVVPDVVDSVEAGVVLMNIIQSTQGVKTGRKKITRDLIRNAFHLSESKKRPQWAQNSEWPVSAGGKPMRFLKQKTEGEMVRYWFEDVDTLEKRIIVDYY